MFINPIFDNFIMAEDQKPFAFSEYQQVVAGGVRYSFATRTMRNSGGPVTLSYAWRGSLGEGETFLGISRYSLPFALDISRRRSFSKNHHGELIGPDRNLRRRIARASAVPLTGRVDQGHRPVVMMAEGNVMILPSVTRIDRRRLSKPFSMAPVKKQSF